MNYGKVEEPNSSRNRYPSTARRAATSAILTVTLSRSDRAPNSRTVNARPGWDADLNAGAQRSPILACVGLFASTKEEAGAPSFSLFWKRVGGGIPTRAECPIRPSVAGWVLSSRQARNA